MIGRERVGKRQRRSSPSSWIRIDPYTGEVTRSDQPIDNVRRHTSADEGSFQRLSATQKAAAKNPQVRCPACQVLVAEKRLANHQRLQCPARSARAATSQTFMPRRTFYPRPGTSRSSIIAGPRTPLPVQSGYQETGVFADDGNFIVVYKGKTIANVDSAAYGWELLDSHRADETKA